MENHELAQCVKINLENFAKMQPHLPIKDHPMWMIAMDQLDTLIKQLEKSEN